MLEVVEVELAPGLVVANKWRLERPIGKGGFGVVWAAVDITTGEPRALKCLTKEGATDPKRQERLRREARAMSAIVHPHIAHVFGLEELPAGTPFIVMELIRGRTLHAQLARGPLSVEQARGILIQIADALRTVHARGIIHRDLKPANVIIVDDRAAKVLDFGIAKDLSSGEVQKLTTTGTALGTLNYMAPEQIFGERNLDPRCDVWALGILAHEVLSLRRPTDGEGENSGQVLKAIVDGNFARLSTKVPGCPADIDDLVARMLLRKASDRPTSEEVFTTLALPTLSPTMRRSMGPGQMIATLPISEKPLFAQTVRDERFAASQLVPSTVVPPTVVPQTQVPSTAIASTVMSPTVVPSTHVPATQVPSTHVPSTVVPSTAVPATVIDISPGTVRAASRPHAVTLGSPQQPMSPGVAHAVAPAVTPSFARASEPTFDIRAQGVPAQRRSGAAIAIAVFAGFAVVGAAIFAVGTMRARHQEPSASASTSASAPVFVSSATPPPVASASASASAPAVASALASAPASSSAPGPIAAQRPGPTKSNASTGQAAQPAQTGQPGHVSPSVRPHAPGTGDPPISNERF